MENQVSVPVPTPASRAIVVPVEVATFAVDAAAKIAAHEAIVSGFEAEAGGGGERRPAHPAARRRAAHAALTSSSVVRRLPIASRIT